MRQKFSILIFGFWLLLISTEPVQAQKFMPDTFFIAFPADTLVPIRNIAIKNARDLRNEDPRFVRYGSKNKLLLFPVDQEVYLHNPLAGAIISTIPDSVKKGRLYSLDVEKFSIETRNRRFSKNTFLLADLSVYEVGTDSTIYQGTLYYDFQYMPVAKKEDLSTESVNLLRQWHQEFKIDLLSLNATDGEGEVVQNYIAGERIKSLFLNARTDAFYGYNFWGMQGEVYFTRPETNSRARHTASLIRYIQNSDYESFAVGRKSEHTFFRRSEKMAFDIDLNILLGICKWKDIEKEEPSLYQIFDFEVSSIQSILFEPLNKKGFIIRLGIIENFSYVIGKTPRFGVGALVGIGYKI